MGRSLERRRINLMKEDPRCRWCNRDLVYVKLAKNQRLPENFPTIDHLNDKFTHSNGRPNKIGEKTRVLACPECNQKRSTEIQKSHKWKNCWKSGTFPFPLGFIGAILKFFRGHKQLNKKFRSKPAFLRHKPQDLRDSSL